LALKLDSIEEYAVFVNESKCDSELNSSDRVFEFLRRKYFDQTIKSTIERDGQIINPIEKNKDL
jgi:hypothetical protein